MPVRTTPSLRRIESLKGDRLKGKLLVAPGLLKTTICIRHGVLNDNTGPSKLCGLICCIIHAVLLGRDDSSHKRLVDG